MKFSLGQLLETKGVMAEINQEEVLSALNRHAQGDWGEICEEDKKLNDEALKIGERLLSAYTSKDGTKFWIITEWDRSATTVLLPEEY
jgi:hypothetical protein